MQNTDFKQWAKAAAIRAVRTVAQAAIATIGASAVMSDVDWAFVASASLLAGILSLLTSVVTGLPEVSATVEEQQMTVDEQSGKPIRKTDNGLKDCDQAAPQHARPLTAAEIEDALKGADDGDA